MGIQAITQQWMADRQHVHTQLVGAAGDGGQFHATVMPAALHDSPEGQGMLALLEVDDMARFAGWVVTQRQLDAPAIGIRLAQQSAV